MKLYFSKIRPFAIGFTLSILLTPGAFAVEQSLAVGVDGAVLGLHSGAYGDLFPDGQELAAEALVLAFDQTVGQETTRLLVPGSESRGAEDNAVLYHDPTMDVTHFLWTTRQNDIHPMLRLVSFQDGWGEVLDITGSVFSAKHDPGIAVQHESFVTAAGEPIERTIINVVWWEDAAPGIEKRFTSLIQENGTLVAASPVLTLGRIVHGHGTGPVYETTLDTVVRLQQEGSSLLVGAVNSRTGALAVTRIETLPIALSHLAAAVEAAIAGYDPMSGVDLKDVVIAALEEAGTDFHAATLEHLAEEVLALIDEIGPGATLGQAIPELMDKAMPHIIFIGARMKSGGLIGAESTVLTLRSEEGAPSPVHHLAVTETASWEVPETGEAPQLFISRRGNAALAAWDDGDTVAYRETTADGWSEVRTLEIGGLLDRTTAYRILEERTLER